MIAESPLLRRATTDRAATVNRTRLPPESSASVSESPLISDRRIRSYLIDQLAARHGIAQPWNASIRAQLRQWRKRLMWRLFVGSLHTLKRSIDISLSVIALLFALPLFAFVGLLIWMADGGPMIFWQTRVGKWGREFSMPKFRSMRTDAEQVLEQLRDQNDHGVNAITFKMKHDPRLTWIGRLIRKSSIDELPQLWSVLKGDMSLVGPRPPIPSEVARYTLRERQRLDVKPGLTCIWQVSGRGDIPFDRQVQLDVEYIHSQSLWGDLMLLARTVPAVLFGRGAY